jgi:hypothetical protein
MNRWILRFRGSGAKPQEDVSRIADLPNTTTLDASSPRMLFVEGPDDEVQEAVAAMPGWTASVEQSYSLPDPRPKPRST